MNVSGDEVQKGLLGLLGLIITGLFTWRGISRVKSDNAKDGRQSRYEDRVQDRLDSALQEIKRLSAELNLAKDGRAMLEKDQREAKRVNTILLEMLEKDQRESAQRWVKASKFADLEDLPKPRKD